MNCSATLPPPDLIVALDYPTLDAAMNLAERLSQYPVTYKLGLELFTAAGPAAVKQLKKLGRPLFLDLKLHDIPNTVEQAAARAGDLGVDYLTVHLMGGMAMLKAAQKGFKSTAASTARLLGVSVLTSFSPEDWGLVARSIAPNSQSSIRSAVTGLVQLGVETQLSGFVCSPHELQNLKRQYPGIFAVVPGIRPEGANAFDQARTMTPEQARIHGAGAIVVGRPITQSQEPESVTQSILDELRWPT